MSYQPVPALGKDFLTPFFDVLLEVVGWGTSLRERVLERVHIQNDEQVLDVGCGTAALLIRAKARAPGAHLVGVDADPHILELARKNITRHGVEVEVTEARAEDLPFPPASFEVVTSTVAEKYILVGQPVHKGCYPHKRSMISWQKAEWRVTDLSQPLT